MKYLTFLCLLTLFFGCNSSKSVTNSLNDEEVGATQRGHSMDTTLDIVANTKVRYEAGVVYLKSVGMGSNKEEAAEQAKINAVKAVLFKGIPGSSVEYPLVKLDDKEKHAAFFKKFLRSGGEYKNYVINSKLDPSKRIKSKNSIQIGIDIEINYAQLQNRLENEGINKTLGIR